MGKHLEPTPIAPEGRVRRTPLWVRRAALIAGLVLIGLGSALAGFSIFKHETPMQLIAQTFVRTPDQVFGKPNILVLIEGLDYDYTDNDIEFSSQSRSDMIKVVNLQFDSKGIYVVSVLRDMLATYPNGSQKKINQAQAEGGTKEAQQVISSFLGIPGFDRYVILRSDATKDLINAIGGIDIYVKNSNCLKYKTNCSGDRLDYDDNWGHLHIHLTEGMHHLNGDQAVGYGRFRHDWCSDPCRSMRQDDVIMAAVNKLRGDKLNTLVHAGDLMNVVHRDMQTNFSNDELLSLASYFSGIQMHDVHFAQTNYTSDVNLADGNDLIPDKNQIADIVQNYLIAPPTPQPSPDAMALAAISPSTVRVDVKNASGMTGAAKAVADNLRKAGFTIGDVGNADTTDEEKTKIEEHSTVSFAGAKVRSALPTALQTTPISGAPVVSASAAASASATATPSDVTVFVGRDLAEAIVAKRANPSASPL